METAFDRKHHMTIEEKSIVPKKAKGEVRIKDKAKKSITDEEFEEMWRKAKEREARDIEEWNALPEEEKKRRMELLNSGFGQRITEDITGGHDDE